MVLALADLNSLFTCYDIILGWNANDEGCYSVSSLRKTIGDKFLLSSPQQTVWNSIAQGKANIM